MMKTFSSRHYKYLFIGANLALLLTLILSACNGASSTTTANSTATKSAGSGNNSTSTGSAPQVKLSTRPCPEAIKDPSYWDPIVGTQANVSKVESVNCANLAGVSSLQALITVRYDGTGQILDVYVYNNITDPTRYQAETAQAQVNQGHQPWRLSAIQTAQALAAKLLHWTPSAPATLLSGGGNSDLNAVVTVKSTNTGSATITATLSRLEGNSKGNIWEATSVTSPDLSISIPQDRDLLTNPITVKGTGNAFEGRVGKVIVLDHLYTDIGHAEAIGDAGNGSTTFSMSVTYNSTFKSGLQEAVVVLYSYSSADDSISGAAMVKEMLS